MNKTGNIRITFASLLLVAALLLPSGIQFVHAIENHNHPSCTDFSTHIHETQLDCSICHFHLSVFSFTPIEENKVFSFSNNFKSTFGNTDSEGHFFSPYRALRGPPVLVQP